MDTIAHRLHVKNIYPATFVDPGYERMISHFVQNIQLCAEIFTQDHRIKRLTNAGKAIATLDQISESATILSYLLKRQVLRLDKICGNFDDDER